MADWPYAYRKHKNAFAETFGRPLHEFWDRVHNTGFDVVLFDEEIVKSGDGNMLLAVREKWGAAAGEMVKELTMA